VRAVNLIPDEQRGSGAGRTGIAVYVLLGGLAAVALALAALVITGNQISHRRSEVAKVQLEATAKEAEARALKPYADFAALRAKRVQTVQSLAQSRFDWPRVLRDLSRAMPRSAWVQTFTGTVAPGVSVEGGGGGGTGLRSALTAPAVELSGCAESQSDVARMMTRLRLIEGVTRVSLGSSTKSGAAGSSGGDSSSGGGCAGSSRWPQFNVVVFFEGQTPPAPSVTATGAQATPAAGTQTQPPAGTQTQPASGTQTQPATGGSSSAPAPTTTTAGSTK
jgi:Tfp pilus assembly protein PilN